MFTPRFPGFLCQMALACGLLLVGLSSALAQVAVSTLVGSSPAIASGNVDATGNAARFTAPASVAVDAAGNLYVADTSNHKIRKVTSAGVVTTFAGSGTQGSTNGIGTAASFNFPQGVATDGTNLFVADTFNHMIRKIVIADQTVTTLAGTSGSFGTAVGAAGTGRLNNPLGVAVSGTDLYVADTSNHGIRKVVISTGVISDFVGTLGTSGATDGTGAAALFKNPGAIAADISGNLYVADTANHTIRKIVITGGGVVTTLAGTASLNGGSTDSTSTAASFKSPGGLVVSGANLFVADTGNSTIRQVVISSQVVTTIAGSAGLTGTVDAIGTAARFNSPTGIGVNTGGTLYIADTNSHTIRSAGAAVAPTVSSPATAAVVVGANPTFTVTVTGNPTATIQWERQAANTTGFVAITASSTYSNVNTATLTVSNVTIAMDGDQFRASVSNGVGGAVASTTPATLTVQQAPAITSVASANFSVNTAGTFTVVATGSPAPTFSVTAGTFPPWASLNSNTGVISGTPTNTAGSPFNFTLMAANGVAPAATQAFVLTVQNGAGGLMNLSVLRDVPVEGLMAHFRIEGTGTKQVFIRVAGPSLGALGVSGTIADPRLDLLNETGAVIAANDNWSGAAEITAAMANVGAFAFTGPATKDAAILAILAPGFYTVRMNGVGGTTGLAIFEIYEVDRSSRTAYFSYLAFRGSANDTLGFVLGGSQPTAIVVRAAGPALQAVGALSDPALSLFNGSGTIIAANDNWGGDATIAAVTANFGAIPFVPTSRDSARFTTLAPGSYSAQVSGVGGTTGVALVEIFDTSASTAPRSPFVFSAPAPQSVVAGQPASFSVTAGGTGALGYQWRRNGTPIAGATLSSYGLSAGFAEAGNYDVVITNSAGSLTTPTASLAVTPPTPPTVISQPVGFTRVVGAVATFSIAASGSAPLTYQWRKDAALVAGATGASLTLTDVQLSNAGSYDVVVTNLGGTVASNPATLTVAMPAPPAISVPPQGNTVYVGGISNFFVSILSLVPVSYQWRFNGTDIPGATFSSYSIGNTQLTHAGSYDVVATNSAGSVTSQTVGLVVVTPTPPSILVAPASVSQFVGGPVTLRVNAFGGPGGSALGYQWRKDGVAIFGATNSTYFLANVAATDAGSYDVVVANTAGSVTSVAVALTVTPAVPPTITSQPIGGMLFSNNIGSFRVTASGSAPLNYQWRKDGVAVVGAVSSSFIVGPVTPVSAGTYDVVVSNAAGSVTSTAAVLGVVANPGFVTQPLGQAVGLGGAVQLTATAIGDLALGYQWRKNGGPLAGATTATYSLTNFESSDQASYDVVVSNSVGSATSSAAVLTLAGGAPDLPVITSVPTNATLNLNNEGSFRVTATSSSPLFYQWRKNAGSIAGATGSVLALGAVTAASAGIFDVVVSNSAGSVTSPPAVLNVNPPVIFNSQPVSASTFVGLGVTFSASATGFPGTPTYQWRKDTVAIVGATSSSLTLPAAQPADAGSYDVIATASAGSATSNAATLSITNSAPQITMQPVGATLAVGGNLALNVTAMGSAPLTYQWRRDGLAITGATTSSFAIVNAQTFDGGLYTVVVTNALGSDTSIGARLNVVPRVVAYSARLQIDPDGAVAVFTVEGTLPKKVLLRAVGPGLAPFGFAGLPDPQLELFNSTGALLAINNDWASSADAAAITTTTAAVGAFALTIGSRDSAVLATLAPGTYTVRAKPASGAGGTGYLELYDADLATGPMSTLPYVAVRGRMGAGGGVVIGGLGSNGRGQRSYLVRAIGATLGLPGAHANPAMLIVRDGTLVGSNDDWDSNPTDAAATTAATARVATFPLPAGARDAALVLSGNLHAGACTVQVGGSDALGGTVLLELHDLDAARPAAFAPAIVSSPVTTTAIAGEAVTLRVLAQGTAPLSYQWRKDGIPLDGATAATLALASVQAGQGGSYTVLVANTLGAATSLSAVLSVQSGGGASAATQAVVGGGYAAGGTATITNTLTFAATATGLGWKVTLPLGWSFVSDAGTLGDVRPAVGTVGALEWAWSTPPASPVTFSYTVRIPPGVAGDQFMASSGIVRIDGSLAQPIATPSPLLVTQITTHTADTNADFRISLVELTRVIELYNTRNGSSRTGCYAVATTTTEDAFSPEPTRLLTVTVALPRYHSADPDRDGKINLLELTRVIELYNTRAGTSRTGQYHLQAGTEDGFNPGP